MFFSFELRASFSHMLLVKLGSCGLPEVLCTLVSKSAVRVYSFFYIIGVLRTLQTSQIGDFYESNSQAF